MTSTIFITLVVLSFLAREDESSILNIFLVFLVLFFLLNIITNICLNLRPKENNFMTNSFEFSIENVRGPP